MSLFAEVFKRIQLFFFAFTLAASSMMLVGMVSGKLDRSVTSTGLAEKFTAYFASSPVLMSMLAGGDRVATVDARPIRGSYSASMPTTSHVQAPKVARDSLQALRQRQQQRVVVSDDFYTGG